LSVALIGLFAMLSLPAFAEEHAAAPAAPAPAVAAPEAPKAEPAKTEPTKEAEKPAGEKPMGKMRDRWKKMTPEQRAEMRKKAETRLGERYDRLKTAEQETIKNIMAEIGKLSKEQRSILMAKIRQQASKERMQRKAMKEMEQKKEAPAADPNAAKH
ncbi:MAG: DUF3106 domain-containing protein, partial [Alphaproteobacteria bacterium]|nr:DUF3106 domain-containing protein [Alphaproteobacteria bacterium]